MSLQSTANRSCRSLEGPGSGAHVARRVGLSPRGGLPSVLLVAALFAGCGGRAERLNGSDKSGANAGRAGASSSVGGASADGGTSGIAGNSDDGGASETCAPGSAPLRRLTNAQYTSTLASVLGDTSQPTAELPSEAHWFPNGNLAADQVGLAQVEAYFKLAKEFAERATHDAKALGALAPCAATPAPDTACARTTIEAFATKAFRRAPSAQELNELLALHTSVASSSGGDFATATRAVIAAVLQAPDFLYRLEWGTGEGPRPDVQRLTGDEMATRLSYLFWNTAPDDDLRAAAQSGALLDPDGVAQQAARLLADPRSHAGLAAFFDDFLELYQLPQLQRDPSYTPALGVTLREATQRTLEAQIFDHDASWPAVLTSSKAFVTGSVASLYGVAGVTGEQWQEVSLDATQRLGLLTYPSSLMVGLPSNTTNPSQRGYRILEKILCRDVPPEPPEISPSPTVDPANATTRQRWTQFTAGATCAPCHRDMDQIGYALEAYDSLGRYRTTENGVTIDTQVNVTGLGPTNGPVELVQKLSALPETQACFAQRFAEFSLGKVLHSDPAGPCLKQDIARRFQAAGYNVRQLLLDLTQTDAFLYLPKER